MKQAMQFYSLGMRSLLSDVDRIKEDGVKIRGPTGLFASTNPPCKSPAESLSRERICC